MRAGIRSVGLIAGTCLLTSCTTDQAGGIMGQVFGQAANTAVQRSVGTLVSSPAVASATQNLCGSDAWGICHNMTANVLSGFSEEFVKRMTQEDVRQLTEAREQAIYTGQPQVWTNPQSGASGSVTSTPAPPKPPAPVQVNALPGRVGTPPEMVAVGEQYTATKTANVRGGPATTYAVVDSLKANEPIMAIGKVKAGDWFMVGRGDVAIGYVASSLISRAPVLPTTPAPAPATPPTPPANVEQTQVVMSAECYTTTQTVKLGDGTSQQAQVTSCRTPNGWAQV
jgi:surface antigen